jgi:hypothetical protein
MTTPSEPDHGEHGEPVDLTKGDPAGEAPFDPYRFGKPDHPIPAEYAPPGYTGPVAPPPTPYEQPNPWAAPQYGAPAGNPFNNPPGTPYGQQPYGQQPYGQQPYPPAPYGPPPMPYGYGPQPRRSNGKAVTAMVLGILSILLCWLFFFDAALVIPGLIFSLIAMSETKGAGGSGRGMAVAGLICTLIGAVLATILTVLLVHAANQCGGFGNSNAPGFDQCLRDHFG